MIAALCFAEVASCSSAIGLFAAGWKLRVSPANRRTVSVRLCYFRGSERRLSQATCAIVVFIAITYPQAIDSFGPSSSPIG